MTNASPPGAGWFRAWHLAPGLLAIAILSGQAAARYEPSTVPPPTVPREFRGAWVTTVANIDWPSKPGLSVAVQKEELITLLNYAVSLKLNALLFQVRPACDAMYASTLEPWSEYLTGAMGKAPSPFYDPLSFAIREAHQRGLELHAWFNPYRAHYHKSWSPITGQHISRTRPQLVRKYGNYLWLDPGEPEVRDYSLKVVMDVVKRYDVDGITFDDYFYPYAEKGADGQELAFPDEASWQRYGAGGRLSRDDWRRENVNDLIARTYQSIKAAKPWVKFGLSPFGIWRPGNPSQIKGFDAHARLYADARKWLQQGWADYFAPQLYWACDAREQSFPVLLGWWAEQNYKHRQLWPGLNAAEAGGKLKNTEIARQIQLTRKQAGASGTILYSFHGLMNNRVLADSLAAEYRQPALVPACSWLGSSPPPSPSLEVMSLKPLQVRWTTGKGEPVRWWVLQYQTLAGWQTEILPAESHTRNFKGVEPEFFAVTGVSRTGMASAAAVVARRN
jgi:uncharacterized lipoprotein YddW (UPF0748 family)